MARRAQSSTTVSAAGTSRDGGKVQSFSGQGRTVNNLIFLALTMGLMIGSFWAFASYPNSLWLWILGLALYTVALLIPVGLLHNSTAKRAVGGRAILMDVPPTTEVPGDEPKAAAFPQGPQNIAERDARTRAAHRDI